MVSSSTVSVMLHGLKPTSPIVTLRPSASLRRGGACHLTSAGKPSHVTSHNNTSAPSAQPSLLNQTTIRLLLLRCAMLSHQGSPSQ